jgi:hypothetical protein
MKHQKVFINYTRKIDNLHKPNTKKYSNYLIGAFRLKNRFSCSKISQRVRPAIASSDLHNANRKLEKEENIKLPSEEFEFARIANSIKKVKGNTVTIKTCEREIEGCFIVCNSQKEWFDSFSNIVHIDSIYITNLEKFALYTFLAQDRNLRGLPLNFCFLKYETSVNMKWMYDQFCDTFDAKAIELFMMDKDLQNIKLLQSILASAQLLLCTFHVIKYLKSAFVHHDMTPKYKKEIMQVIFKLVYARAQSELPEL